MEYGDLRAMLRYVPRFRGRIFVLSLDGGVLLSPMLETVLLDFALLHSLSVRLVICYGIEKPLRELAAKRGIVLQDSLGDGVTDEAGLDLALEVAGRCGQRLLGSLRQVGLPAALSNAIEALPLGKIGGVDLQHTGRADEVDVTALRALLERDQVVVLPPLGIDPRGRMLRINADRVAEEAAIALGAAKWIVLGAGELFPDGIRRQLSIEQAKALATDVGEPVAGRLRRGARACEGGVSRAHFLNGLEEGALLAELFSNEGVGHMVHADEYGLLRPLQAGEEGVLEGMLRLSVEDQLILGRNAADIEARLEDFAVLEIDGNLVGCVALHERGDGVGELACLHVRPSHEHQGYGRRLVEHALHRARSLGLTRVVALTTGARDYFQALGWREIDAAALPPARRADWERSRRNSWVFETRP